MKTIYLPLFLLLFTPGALFAKMLYEVDYGKVQTDNALEWLESQNYEFQRNVEEMRPEFRDGKLYFRPEKDIFGAMTFRVEIPGAKRVKIFWGINRFHEKGNYEKGIYRESASVLINFGYDKQPSGRFFISDLPPFLNIIFGHYENPNKQYTGNYFKKGGRVICPSCGVSVEGKEVVTEADLEKEFKKAFPKRVYEMVTAFTITTDVRDTDVQHEFFIRKIQFFD